MNRRTYDDQGSHSAGSSRLQDARETAELRTSIGERIAAARKKAALSQKELAEKIGAQVWAVSRYETGRMFPRVPLLRKLSRVLDVSTDYLLALHPEPKTPGLRPEEGKP
jgi:ribosome-binding protein aMBF1 (putative translation factor)